MTLVSGNAIKGMFSSQDFQSMFPNGPRPAAEVALLDIPPDLKYAALVEAVSTNALVPTLLFEHVWGKVLETAYKHAIAKGSTEDSLAAWDKHWHGAWDVEINVVLRILREDAEG